MTSAGSDAEAVGSAVDASDWLPCPLVPWDRLAAAIAPGKPASRSRLRSLRDKRQISRGVKVTHRGDKGVAGASSFYSVLSLWAERARDRGLADDAERLRSAATEVEDEFAAQLKDFLSRRPLNELPKADFFWDLAHRTSRALAQSKTWRESVLAVASVTDIDERFIHLEGRSIEGAPRSVDLPRHLMDANGLHAGSFVFVLSRRLGSGAFVEVDEAVPCRREGTAGVRTECFAEPETSESGDPSTPQTYGAGPGAALTPELASRAWKAAQDAGVKPSPLRPAG